MAAKKPSRRILTLVITDQCNLNCTYCYERSHKKRVMPLHIAQEAVEQAFCEDGEELEIQFFGGEPFMAFGRMKEICEWLWGRHFSKPYVIFANTNGTLIHGEVAKWAEDHHHDIVLGLSLDGTESMHNANRSNSYSRINVDFFKRLWPFQSVKMTISKESLPTLAEGIIHLTEQGLKIEASLAQGIDWSEDDARIFARELRLLADYYIANPAQKPVSIVAMPLQIKNKEQRTKKFCGTGTNMTCIASDGKKYPCHTFMPLTTGSSSIDIEAVYQILRADDTTDDKCLGCPIIDKCPTCYGINFIERGNPILRGRVDCMMEKIRARASAYLLAKMLTHKDREYVHISEWSKCNIYNATKAIQAISRDLNFLN